MAIENKSNNTKSTEKDTSTEEIEQNDELLSDEDKIKASDNIIKNNMMLAMGAGAVPIPTVDIIALTGIQLNMINSLCKLYGQEFRKDMAKSFIASLGTGVVAIPIAIGLSSLVKSIPVLGQTAGVISMATTGTALTYAIGRVFVQHFASGGTFLDFNPKAVKEYFKKEFDNGKDKSKEAKAA